MRTNKGFSLIELMVSVGILGMIAVGVVSAFSSGYKMNQILDAKREANSLMGQLRTALGTSVSCTQNLGGLVVNGPPNTPITISTPITEYSTNGREIRDANNKPVYVVNTSAASSTLSAFKVGSVTLTPGPDVKVDPVNGVSQKLATLTIADTRSGGLGQVRTLPVSITYNTSTGRITSCVSGIDLQADTMNDVCNFQNPPKNYNPSCNCCVSRTPPPPVTYIQSDNPYTVNCPTGMKLNNPWSCWSKAPTNWTNPLQPICDTINGVQQCNTPSATNCYATDNTYTGCTCDYAVGVDPTNGGNYPGGSLSSFFTIEAACIH